LVQILLNPASPATKCAESIKKTIATALEVYTNTVMLHPRQVPDVSMLRYQMPFSIPRAVTYRRFEDASNVKASGVGWRRARKQRLPENDPDTTPPESWEYPYQMLFELACLQTKKGR
jgi:hypothetical protein